MLTLVPTVDVPTLWPGVADLLNRAVKLSKGRRALPEVYEALCKGDQQLWIVFEGKQINSAFTTSVAQYPGRLLLRIDLCGGSRVLDWVGEALEQLKLFARSANCSAIEMIGRKGWERMLPNIGMKPLFKVYEMEVS